MTTRNAHPLPEVLIEISTLVDIDAALAIAEARGGQEITLPAEPGLDHWLTVLVGHEAALKICEYYRAEHRLRILIPTATLFRRWTLFLVAQKEGLSIHDTAERLQVHRRTVFRLRRLLREMNKGNQNRQASGGSA